MGGKFYKELVCYFLIFAIILPTFPMTNIVTAAEPAAAQPPAQPTLIEKPVPENLRALLEAINQEKEDTEKAIIEEEVEEADILGRPIEEYEADFWSAPRNRWKTVLWGGIGAIALLDTLNLTSKLVSGAARRARGIGQAAKSMDVATSKYWQSIKALRDNIQTLRAMKRATWVSRLSNRAQTSVNAGTAGATTRITPLQVFERVQRNLVELKTQYEAVRGAYHSKGIRSQVAATTGRRPAVLPSFESTLRTAGARIGRTSGALAEINAALETSAKMGKIQAGIKAQANSAGKPGAKPTTKWGKAKRAAWRGRALIYLGALFLTNWAIDAYYDSVAKGFQEDMKRQYRRLIADRLRDEGFLVEVVQYPMLRAVQRVWSSHRQLTMTPFSLSGSVEKGISVQSRVELLKIEQEIIFTYCNLAILQLRHDQRRSRTHDEERESLFEAHRDGEKPILSKAYFFRVSRLIFEQGRLHDVGIQRFMLRLEQEGEREALIEADSDEEQEAIRKSYVDGFYAEFARQVQRAYAEEPTTKRSMLPRFPMSGMAGAAANKPECATCLPLFPPANPGGSGEATDDDGQPPTDEGEMSEDISEETLPTEEGDTSGVDAQPADSTKAEEDLPVEDTEAEEALDEPAANEAVGVQE